MCACKHACFTYVIMNICIVHIFSVVCFGTYMQRNWWGYRYECINTRVESPSSSMSFLHCWLCTWHGGKGTWPTDPEWSIFTVAGTADRLLPNIGCRRPQYICIILLITLHRRAVLKATGTVSLHRSSHKLQISFCASLSFWIHTRSLDSDEFATKDTAKLSLSKAGLERSFNVHV